MRGGLTEHPAPRYAVELVRFAGPSGVATEARTVYRPEPRRVGPVASIDEAAFLERVDDPAFRASLERVLEEARKLGYRIEWGVRGGAIKLPTPDHPGAAAQARVCRPMP